MNQILNSQKQYKLVVSHYKKKIEIPTDWTYESLQSKINILSGFAFKSKNFNLKKGLPLIRIRDLSNSETEIRYNGDFSEKFLIKTGDLLVGMDGDFHPYLWRGNNALLNQRVCKITTLNEHILNQNFLYHIIGKELLHLERINVGTTVIHISKTDIEQIRIFLPPLKEQQKIASILSNVDAYIQKNQQHKEELERLKKGLMQKLFTEGIGHKKFKKARSLFGKYVLIPDEWKIKKFNDIFEFLTTGTNPRSDLENRGDIQYIHYGDIHTKWNTILDCSSEKIPYISKTKVTSPSFLKNGDLIIVDASEDYDGSGTSILLKNVGCKKIVSGLHTFVLRNKDQSISLDFKAYLTSIKFVKSQIISYVTGVSVYGLSKSNLKNIKIILPKIEEQQKIASILSNVDAYIQKNQQHKEELERLKKGLMQKLLTGKIRVPVS